MRQKEIVELFSSRFLGISNVLNNFSFTETAPTTPNFAIHSSTAFVWSRAMVIAYNSGLQFHRSMFSDKQEVATLFRHRTEYRDAWAFCVRFVLRSLEIRKSRDILFEEISQTSCKSFGLLLIGMFPHLIKNWNKIKIFLMKTSSSFRAMSTMTPRQQEK